MKIRNRLASPVPSSCLMLVLAGTTLAGVAEARGGAVPGHTSQALGNAGPARSAVDDVTRALEGYNYVIRSNGSGAVESVLVSGENGSGKNARLAETVLPAGGTKGQPLRIAAAEPNAGQPLNIHLKENVQGQAAIDALGDKLPAAAAEVGMSAEKLKNILLQDSTAWIDQGGRLLYVEKPPALPEEANATTATAPVASAAAVPLDLTKTFKLHSRPGSRRVIYLDFNGHTVTNSVWNTAYKMPTITAPGFNVTGTASTFDTGEQQTIQYIWRRVAEDYSPFDVDVTTEEPPAASILRTDTADLNYGTRVVITTNILNCGCGGIAYVGTFDTFGAFYQPAWVFYDLLSGREKYVAEAISHEAGHNLGLSHDGAAGTSYYSGHGSGATGWAPIMGSGYSREVTHWSKGEYTGANNKEDDFSVIQSNGAAVRADDAGNTIATAKPLGGAAGATGFAANQAGVIERQTDVDLYSFATAGGAVSLTIAPADRGPDLDISALLINSAGQTIASSNPVDRLDASFSLTLPAGNYFLRIDGTGKAATATDQGYSDYGSLGQYFVTGQFAASAAQAPVASAAAVPSSGTAPLPVSFQSSGTVSSNPVVGFAWNFGDGSAVSQEPNPLHTFANPGSYEVWLTITDSAGLKSEKLVKIEVTPDPNLNSPRTDRIAISLRRSGSLARAVAEVTVTNAAGQPVSNAKVLGKWSGLTSGDASGATSGWGVVRLISPIFSSRPGTATFTVTSVSLDGHTYKIAPGANTTASISQ